MGARFAKWRAVIAIGDDIPSRSGLEANAHALARYTALCEEAGLVPIVEPEVLMDGEHTLERCRKVTEEVLRDVFILLNCQRVLLEGMNLRFKSRLPWTVAFSFARAIQHPPLEILRGQEINGSAAQRALLHRTRCNRAARRGDYRAAMESL